MFNKENIERNLGEQPIKQIMLEHDLKPHDIVVASTDQITHLMIKRAARGRRLTKNVQIKVLNALNKALNKEFGLKDLFNYR